MEIYLVGGAVRDALLGLPVSERDWVVVGATPEEMLRLGFQPVGKDFPVFLHPQTHEEYALARTERKTGKGYKGFTFYSAPDVSLIADLQRRDLTINAIAQNADGQLIDPYGGQTDLKNKVLRHVSLAFQEDPVRILRIARFNARFTEFSIYPSTLELMQNMVANGEVDALVPERVWQEFCRALNSVEPGRFLTILKQCGALAVLFPEIKLTQTTMKALENARKSTEFATTRFAALLHELSEQSLSALCNRYRVPREFSDLALLTARWYKTYQLIPTGVTAKEIFILLKAVDARRRPERFQQFLQACDACTDFAFTVAGEFLQNCMRKILALDMQSLQLRDLKGSEIAYELEKWQLNVIQTELQNIPPLTKGD